MDPVEILGAMLGNKSGGGGGAGALIQKVLGGGGGGQSGGGSQGGGPDLGGLLRDAYSKYQQRGGGGGGGRGGAPARQAPVRQAPQRQASELDSEQAVILIRAMINAAKSDGQLDQKEQDGIVGQLGDVTQEEINFLRTEFAKPLDVREFAWSVPLGLEEQAYGVSLMAIDLDQNKEAKYLHELAHGLRLKPDVCNNIHRQMGAQPIFR